MDLPPDPAREPQTDPLASLALRVAELEREVAALKSASLSIPPPAAAAHRTFRPLPPALDRLLPDSAAPPSVAVSPPRPSPRSLEDRIGSQVFSRVGIVALLIAASWGLKLAFENQLIGETGRVVIGLLAGAGLVLWSERFRRNGSPAFSYSLKAVGTGVLYLTLWAAFQIYGVLPAPLALGLMIAVTAWNAFMAWSQNSELLAAYALSGAFATPVLLSTGGNHEVFLFTYLGAIDIATLLLLRLKPWPRLLLSALIATAGFFFGWYLRFYDFVFMNGLSGAPFALTTAFLLGFAVVFALGSVRGFLRWTESTPASPEHIPSERLLGRSPAILSILVPLLNAAFLALGLSVLVRQHFGGDLLPWLMVALSLAYLLLMRVQRTVTSSALHLALAVIFLTIAIPLKASGHTLTVAWFAEGIALLWASTRIGPSEAGPAPYDLASRLTPARILRALSFAGYLLGFCALVFSRFLANTFNRYDFFSTDLFSTLFAASSFAAAAWLCLRPSAETHPRGHSLRFAILAFLGLEATALMLASREFASRFYLNERPFLNPYFASALIALALLAASAFTLWKLSRDPAHPASGTPDREPFERLAAGTFVLFNLLAIFSVETEINALWQRSDANLQRSLAVSAFLMLYGAALLTLGFVQRSAFTRWQALILILFTILKVFLYDMSSLQQGYRVVSFMGLGVLLLAISFVYQKDWLGLKTAPAEPSRESGS